ncbi:YaiI/YqxD family protein [Gallaecimonas kandeliae]|uniref:YaiI/YqxD family protein n=1 Tax=Gallaecimonas kandeliae TaxID=3029055 RepID=UPI0026499721|nr:YaiI/YqxD family protein [Gallaecimonas kandeliae]WKE64880.1 YaiI/YqxD family protein [Gallaecimonas kandeliae]
MTIWVDADACPRVIKDILFRAAERTQTEVVLVANQSLQVPPGKWVRSQVVPKGFDVADNHIVQQALAGDLVVTADIPLAAEVMEKGAQALNPRGELYRDDTIRQRLQMRDFMDTLRASGIQTGGPPPISQSERQAFGNALDRYLQQKRR